MEYFYIASKVNGHLLGLDGSHKEAKLTVQQSVSKDDQLWTWDDGHLLCKNGLAMDISEKSKKKLAQVHGWPKQDAWNQQWKYELGCLVCGETGLVLGVNTKSNAIMVESSEDENWNWLFIPEDLKEDLKSLKGNWNPLAVAYLWQLGWKKYFRTIIGFTIAEYQQNTDEVIKTLEKCAKALDGINRDVGITKATGGGASIAGGGMAIAGLFLAPFTAGLSLGLTVGGAVLGAAGGVTTLTGTIVNTVHDKSKGKKVGQVIASFTCETDRLYGFLNTYATALYEAAKYLESNEGKEIVTALVLTGKGVLKAATAGAAAVKFFNSVKNIKEMRAVVAFIQADYYALNGAKVGLALHSAAPGLKVPIVGKVLVTAGGTGAKALSGVLGAVGVGFGIWDTVSAASQLKNGSEAAKGFRKAAEEVKPASEAAVQAYKDFEIKNA